MPKSKSRSKKKKRRQSAGTGDIPWGGPYSARKRRRDIAIVAVVLAAIGGGGGFLWWQSQRAEAEFLTLAAAGESALARVRNMASAGGGHLNPGQTQVYESRIPTSGIHDRRWVKPGMYDTPQRPTQLVHAVEHGNIVIYYQRPGAAVLETLEGWTGLYGGQWDGIVVTPLSGPGETVVLTAWRKRLDLSPFDPAAAAAFIDAYRGRGPENPVR